MAKKRKINPGELSRGEICAYEPEPNWFDLKHAMNEVLSEIDAKSLPGYIKEPKK